MKEKIIEYLQEGKTYREISILTQRSKATISYHAKNAGLQKFAVDKKRYNWDEVQLYHNNGHGVRETIKFFGMSNQAWQKATKRGDVVSNGHDIIPIEVLLVSDRITTARTYLKNRLIREGYLENKCYKCGIVDWLGESLSIELHHINGINNDNRLENLTLLCPNCHSQEPTWTGKNRKKK